MVKARWVVDSISDFEECFLPMLMERDNKIEEKNVWGFSLTKYELEDLKKKWKVSGKQVSQGGDVPVKVQTSAPKNGVLKPAQSKEGDKKQ